MQKLLSFLLSKINQILYRNQNFILEKILLAKKAKNKNKVNNSNRYIK